jgi:4-hydroxybenzoate polyprenyltransferase
VALPRSGVELMERIAERWRWFVFRVRFHPLTTNELPRLASTVGDYVALMRLDRPIGIWLLLWPTLWALWIAGHGKPEARLFIIFVIGTVLMRSAGCAINDYADRSFDPHVERTKDRPLAAGRISTVEALVLFAALSLTALGLALQLNKLTLLFAVAGAALAVTYPFIKRFLSVPQLYLGVTFGWGIPMAFVAERDEWPPRVGWLLLIANVLWVTVYDTIYAMVDRDDDIKIGVRSTAILQAMTVLALYLVGKMVHMGPWYYWGLGAGGIFFVRHLWLIRGRDRDACFRAFLGNHYFGLSVFLGIALNYQFGR